MSTMTDTVKNLKAERRSLAKRLAAMDRLIAGIAATRQGSPRSNGTAPKPKTSKRPGRPRKRPVTASGAHGGPAASLAVTE